MKPCCEKCGYPTDEWVCIEGKYYCIDCVDEMELGKELIVAIKEKNT